MLEIASHGCLHDKYTEAPVVKGWQAFSGSGTAFWFSSHTNHNLVYQLHIVLSIASGLLFIMSVDDNEDWSKNPQEMQDLSITVGVYFIGSDKDEADEAQIARVSPLYPSST